MKKKDIEITHSKITSETQTLHREDLETTEMQAAITALEAQRDAHLAARDASLAQVQGAQRQIEARVAAQTQHRRALDAQARFNVPELDFWTTNLCLSIEGVAGTGGGEFEVCLYACG